MPDTFNADPLTDPIAPISEFTLVGEVGDAPDNATTPYSMAVGDIFQGTVGAAGDDDWVAISLTAGVTYTISLTGQGLTNGLSDPYLELYAGNGTTLLASNDDGGSGANSLITFTPATTGTYYISAAAWGANTGDYALTVNEPDTDASFETLVEYLTDGYWEDSGRNAHAFDTSLSNVITVDITGLTAEGMQLARWAFEAWENVADIDFVEVVSGGQITFTDDGAGLSAGAGYSASGTTTISSNINITQGWLSTFGTTIGSYSMQTYIHELGHSLGLGHQGDYNGSGVTYATHANFRNDSWAMSIMSYFDQTENPTIPNTYARLVGGGMIDIAAMQNLYGASTGGNSAGNSTWGYNSNLTGYMGTLFASMLDGPADPTVFGGPVAITVYDVGGIDTLDFSGETVGMTLNLNAETFSTVDSFRGSSGTTPVNNLTIARGTVIENAIGGSGNDAITGNDANNQISGGAGSDTLTGGGGNDTLQLFVSNAGDLDVLDGGSGAADVADFSGFGSAVWVDLSYGGSEAWTKDTSEAKTGGGAWRAIADLSGIERLTGTAFDDMLAGDGGANVLNGGGGDDRLRGGAGSDTFVFNAGADVIEDLSAAQSDRIALDISALGLAGLSAAQIVSTYASTATGEVVFDFGSGDTLTLQNVTTTAGLEALIDLI